MQPACFVKYITCTSDYINHLANYIQICGIIAGM